MGTMLLMTIVHQSKVMLPGLGMRDGLLLDDLQRNIAQFAGGDGVLVVVPTALLLCRVLNTDSMQHNVSKSKTQPVPGMFRIDTYLCMCEILLEPRDCATKEQSKGTLDKPCTRSRRRDCAC